MTVGKDVSALFPDVVNCMQTDNLELKKLVYLYLMNYAKSQPDMAIMAVNTFVKVNMACLLFTYFLAVLSNDVMCFYKLQDPSICLTRLSEINLIAFKINDTDVNFDNCNER